MGMADSSPLLRKPLSVLLLLVESTILSLEALFFDFGFISYNLVHYA
jgi:hypothetical protein